MTRYSILKPGYNCWRIEHARRASFLIDAADYYKAFRAAAAKARHSILMLGWDIDSRVQLVRGEDPGPLPNSLCDFLNALVSRHGGPRAYVLTWDFAMLYALDREWLPLYKLDWRTHRRLQFRMDDKHPPGGSHHQKVVVVDDTVAFTGGLDITRARWDTPEHRPGDTRRIEVEGKPAYRPFHDVQVLVEGDAARALGDLVRDRWQRATGRRIQPTPAASAGEPWPDGLAPDVTDVALAIARTDPIYDGRPEVREIELLYRDAIRAARRYIYIENQFFTANVIVDALAARLEESDGPEIVLVLALRTDGWLSQQTMDVLRSRMVHRLRQVDRHGRLRVYYPDLPGLEPHCINVHSKVMIVDDEFVRVGSANLNNRSMGIDTECDVAFEASGAERVRQGIRGFRDRLLGEHLGREPAQVAAEIAHRGGVIAGIEALQGGARTLREFAVPSPEEIKSWLPSPELLDPERPIDPDKLADEFVPPEERVPTHRRLMLGLGLLVTLLGLAAAWKWTPLGEWLNVETLSDYIATFSDGPYAPFIAIGAFVLGGLLVAPVTLLVVVSALAFGPALGSIYSLVGGLASAALVYSIGHALGRNTVRRLAGSRLNRLSKRLGERGIIAITVLRMLPVAPYSIVNLVAGASHIRFRDFMIGTVLGLLPGIIAINFFVDRVGATFQNPGIGSALALVAVVLVIAAGAIWLRRWATRHGAASRAASTKKSPAVSPG